MAEWESCCGVQLKTRQSLLFRQLQQRISVWVLLRSKTLCKSNRQRKNFRVLCKQLFHVQSAGETIGTNSCEERAPSNLVRLSRDLIRVKVRIAATNARHGCQPRLLRSYQTHFQAQRLRSCVRLHEVSASRSSWMELCHHKPLESFSSIRQQPSPCCARN